MAVPYTDPSSSLLLQFESAVRDFVARGHPEMCGCLSGCLGDAVAMLLELDGRPTKLRTEYLCRLIIDHCDAVTAGELWRFNGGVVNQIAQEMIDVFDRLTRNCPGSQSDPSHWFG